MKRKITAMILTAAVTLSASCISAGAITWITVSKWAYTDVSNFRKEGLLPSSMSGISDYTAEINRLQFAEILYTSLVKSRLISENRYTHRFEDVDSAAASYLKDCGIAEGELAREDEYKNKYYNFNPDKPLTREEMAVMLYRTVKIHARGLLKSLSVIPDDSGELSEQSKEAVCAVMGAGIMSGVGENRFNPQGRLTVEQAIASVYRLYRMYPTAPNADGAGIRTTVETYIQSYENGMTETIKDNVLYIKNGSDVIMEFETDLYSCIDAVTADGKNYAVAQHRNKKTDVYDTETKRIVFSIPYPYASADSEYIVTETSDIGPMAFGLYDYSGREILEPKYSRSEIEELKANNFEFAKEEYRAPDGWFYYADWHDEGHLYKVDTNGENKQKLSDNDCFNIAYINGWLFYSVRGEDENKLYCIREDGKYEQRLTENIGCLAEDANVTLTFGDVTVSGVGFYPMIAFGHTTDSGYIYGDEWVYYVEQNESNGGRESGAIYRVRFTDDGTAVKEKVSGDVNIYAGGRGTNDILWRDGVLYFKSKVNKDAPDSVYSFKDGQLKKISGDKDVSDIGFTEDGRLVFSVITGRSEKQFDEDYSYVTGQEIYVFDGESFEFFEEAAPYIEQELARKKKMHDNWLKNRENGEAEYYGEFEIGGNLPEECVLDDISDERFTVYYTLRTEKRADGGIADYADKLYVRDGAGNETLVNDGFDGIKRIDDVLYFECDNFSGGGSQKALMSYSLTTGEKRIIADDIREIKYASTDVEDTGKRWILYTDSNLNMCRYDIKEDKCSQIFPNSGSKKYGEFAYLITFGEKEGAYKVDTDGNITALTDTLTMYPQYVPNGAEVGNHGTLYEMKNSIITKK